MDDAALQIPDSWSWVLLGKLMSFQNGLNTDKSAYRRGLRFANAMEVISHSHLAAQDIPGRVSTSSAETNRYMVRTGDVLFNRTSETQEEVGLASVYDDDEPILFGSFVLRGKLLNEQLFPQFAGYGLRSSEVRRQIMSSGQGGIRANVGQASLSAIRIALPPCAEQEAIAEALTDADGVIEGLERLIAKKRRIKQGAMQDLLTAKRRLPGFSGERDTRPLGAIAAFITKGATPTTYGFDWQDFGVTFLRSECVSARGLELTQASFVSEAAHRMLRRSEVRGGDLLITIARNVGRVVKLPDEFGVGNINQHIARLRIEAEGVDRDFVYHQLTRPDYLKYFSSIVTGQAYPQISLRQVRDALVTAICSHRAHDVVM